MDFVAVFSFFSENVELTAQQRLAELICVTAVFLLSAAAVAVLLSRKIKSYRICHSERREESRTEQGEFRE